MISDFSNSVSQFDEYECLAEEKKKIYNNNKAKYWIFTFKRKIVEKLHTSFQMTKNILWWFEVLHYEYFKNEGIINTVYFIFNKMYLTCIPVILSNKYRKEFITKCSQKYTKKISFQVWLNEKIQRSVY